MSELPTIPHECQKMRQVHPVILTRQERDFSMWLKPLALNILHVVFQFNNFRAQVIQFSSMFQKRGKKIQCRTHAEKKVCGGEGKKIKMKNNHKNSGHFVPQPTHWAVHTLRSDQFIGYIIIMFCKKK